jgi:hypothetical protein
MRRPVIPVRNVTPPKPEPAPVPPPPQPAVLRFRNGRLLQHRDPVIFRDSQGTVRPGIVLVTPGQTVTTVQVNTLTSGGIGCDTLESSALHHVEDALAAAEAVAVKGS